MGSYKKYLKQEKIAENKMCVWGLDGYPESPDTRTDYILKKWWSSVVIFIQKGVLK